MTPTSDAEPTPQVLCDVHQLTGLVPTPAGVLWKLAEGGRQLDANLVHLPPRQGVETHAETELDVLLLVVAGTGTLGGAEGPEPLTAGALIWLPRGCVRSITAHAEGLSYLTVHLRRPGIRIRPSVDRAPSHAR
ncbi:hypothetical protein ACFU76_26875 [Streptomyces sp. NPDC057539]|uniref:hypothetical protein n=1 Tax=Streptomyces sp. NPDC057539 TaxID=3346159 RepID=UPI00369CDE6D